MCIGIRALGGGQRPFADALALHLGERHGPGAHPANRPAHQIRQCQACRARLDVPLGTLRLAGVDLTRTPRSALNAPLRLRGSEGAQPPASPCRGCAKRGPRGQAGWLRRLTVRREPAARRTPSTRTPKVSWGRSPEARSEVSPACRRAGAGHGRPGWPHQRFGTSRW